MARPIQLAKTFHEIAWPFLDELGFELVGDPGAVDSPYCGSKAVYQSRNGFFLLVGFEPLDGRTAGISCGRSWTYTMNIPGKPTVKRYSNRYCVLAKRLGFDVPGSYELDVDDDSNSDIQAIVDDLNETLPQILQRVTEEDLVAIEQEEGGCQWLESRSGSQPGGLTFARKSTFGKV